MGSNKGSSGGGYCMLLGNVGIQWLERRGRVAMNCRGRLRAAETSTSVAGRASKHQASKCAGKYDSISRFNEFLRDERLVEGI